MYNKKGAIFGLDGRIAMAVFGILSIFVAASVFSSLNKAVVQKVLAESKQIANAVDDYHKDISRSVFDSLSASVVAQDDIEKAAFTLLVNKTNLNSTFDDRWQGPYLRLSSIGNLENFLNKEYRLVKLSNTLSTTCNDTNTNPCYVFLKFDDLPENDCTIFTDEAAKKGHNEITSQAAGTGRCDLFIKLTLDY